MIKTIGAVLCLLGFSCVGYVVGENYKRRVLEIYNQISMVKGFKREIEYNKCDLHEVFENTIEYTNYPCKTIIENAMYGIEKETNVFSEIWKKSVYDYKKITDKYLKKNDYELLIKLGERIGHLGIDAQIEAFSFFVNEATQRLESIKADINNRVKVARTLGIACGIMFTILLI